MKPVYIGATSQDSGKTSVSLGLMQVLRDKKLDPGYMKPVGQHYVKYEGHNIDEDAVLVHKVFDIKDNPACLSPIAIERGFTKHFIFDPDVKPLEDKIVTCYEELNSKHSMVIVEGTGHAGVGSCFGLSNAKVAQLLGAKVIIVTSGGIGKPIDEVALNLSLFKKFDVDVAGVILNKVMPDKIEMVRMTVKQGLKNLGARLIGVIPYDRDLTFFTMGQLVEEFNYQVLCGEDKLLNRIENTIIAAMEPKHALKYIAKSSLVIVSSDRINNIKVAIDVLSSYPEHERGGLILTGSMEMTDELKCLIDGCQIPVLCSPADTFRVSSQMASLEFKIRSFDTEKISKLHTLTEENVDISYILNRLE